MGVSVGFSVRREKHWRSIRMKGEGKTKGAHLLHHRRCCKCRRLYNGIYCCNCLDEAWTVHARVISLLAFGLSITFRFYQRVTFETNLINGMRTANGRNYYMH